MYIWHTTKKKKGSKFAVKKKKEEKEDHKKTLVRVNTFWNPWKIGVLELQEKKRKKNKKKQKKNWVWGNLLESSPTASNAKRATTKQ